MVISRLEDALSYYDQTLTELEQAEGKLSPPVILRVLFARDKVQSALTETTRVRSESFLKMVQLDDRLGNKAELIAKSVPLEKWRISLKPSADAWWWFLDTLEHPLDRFDWLWQILTLILLTASISLLVEISNRFLKGGVDWLGAFAVIAQGLIALVAASSALSNVGHTAVEQVLKRLRLPQYVWQESKLLISFTLLVFLYGIWSCLPWLASYLNDQGLTRYRKGDLAEALSNFERATNLDSNNLKAHYNLGRLYEDLQEMDKARIHYQIAARGGLAQAFNESGRLSLQSKKLPEAAALLQRGLELAKTKRTRYALLKNLGWVRLEQKRYHEAETHLRQAIALENDFKPPLAAAHCLLAQVLQKKIPPVNARREWQTCLERADATVPEEDTWRGLARERLNKQGAHDAIKQ